MIEIYGDELKTTILVSAKGNGGTDGFWVESVNRIDETKGGLRRAWSGSLRGWSLYEKYEDYVNITNAKESTITALNNIAEDRQVIYYCPDVDQRSTELYEAMIEVPIASDYNPLSDRYSAQIRIREV